VIGQASSQPLWDAFVLIVSEGQVSNFILGTQSNSIHWEHEVLTGKLVRMLVARDIQWRIVGEDAEPTLDWTYIKIHCCQADKKGISHLVLAVSCKFATSKEPAALASRIGFCKPDNYSLRTVQSQGPKPFEIVAGYLIAPLA
jgi:hypothetical protein